MSNDEWVGQYPAAGSTPLERQSVARIPKPQGRPGSKPLYPTDDPTRKVDVTVGQSPVRVRDRMVERLLRTHDEAMTRYVTAFFGSEETARANGHRFIVETIYEHTDIEFDMGVLGANDMHRAVFEWHYRIRARTHDEQLCGTCSHQRDEHVNDGQDECAHWDNPLNPLTACRCAAFREWR